VAPCQTGMHGSSESYGHSMIIDPWGIVLADGGLKPGIVSTTINLSLVTERRAMIPSLKHDRPYLEVGETVVANDTKAE
jgi:predicted amidohydrolase